jgi:hypothetical protein
MHAFDHLVVGGGLGGLMAARTLSQAGGAVILIDQSLPEARGALGGFTQFSGAKFSLLPAGQGLIHVAGSVEKLQAATTDVLECLEISHLVGPGQHSPVPDKPLADSAALRVYESIVLTPSAIKVALDALASRLGTVRIVSAEILRLERIGPDWVAFGAAGEIARARYAIFAGGRTGGSLLSDAGAIPQRGKGLDVGLRIEFSDKNAITGLRRIGADAKVLMGRTRTFCLNHPGRIFRYKYRDISVPGGVVAPDDERSANFGILTRVPHKDEALEAVLRVVRNRGAAYLNNKVVSGAPFQDKADWIEQAYGEEVACELKAFAEVLGRKGLVNWNADHMIHFPLLDWHWDVFAIGTSHRTSRPGLYIAGDTAGHARGLLQAGISGLLAAQEVLADAGA